MKDYSKYIKSALGFILKYEIKDGIIYVYTAKSKKGEPHEYPATKENIEYFENRLEDQYQMVIENKKLITFSELSKIRSTYLIGGVAFTLSMILFALGGVVIPTITTILSVSSLILSGVFNQIYKNDLKELKVFEKFMKEKENLEENINNPNLTKYLKQETLDKIEENQTLKDNRLISNVFNIDFMDKVSLEELKNLLLRYEIDKNFHKDQRFVIPSEIKENLGITEECLKSKTRTRKK